jgi:DNA-binding PadR family transcriptional regulator
VSATSVERATQLTTTEAAVLALIATRGEASGYDLLAGAKATVGHVWAPARSRLYAVLPRLVERGLAESRRVVQQSRPDKHVYRLTAAGTEALDAWLAAPDPGAEDAFYLRLFVGHLMPRETLAEHVRQFRRAAEERLAVLREIEPTNRREGSDLGGWFMLRLGIERAEHSIRWADWVLEELDA